MKFMQASEELLKNHYADLSSKPFFAGLVKYMASGPVLAMVWEGLNAVETGRVMLGATNPADSAPGPSEVTSASRLVVTSATALTQLSLLTRRLVSVPGLRALQLGQLPEGLGLRVDCPADAAASHILVYYDENILQSIL